jgi:serine/threonine protein kinase
MILRQGLRTILAGVAVGALIALALTRTLRSLLFGVSATDPLTFGAVALALVGSGPARLLRAGAGGRRGSTRSRRCGATEPGAGTRGEQGVPVHYPASCDELSMICPACKALNDDSADACFTCGRALTALTQGSIIATRYEVQSPLGKGGMGMVYKAHDRMLDETVAIKVLRAEFANTGEMAKRFRHEIKLARKVSHRNVCRIHEYGEDGGVRYISMEYVEGTDIKQLARDKGGYLEHEEAFDVSIQTADGLQAIHDVGIIHRDLKTSNIMRDNSGRVRLMDFGIAKIGGSDRSTGGGGLTSTGQIMGTPEYMSPEQCLGDKIDHRSDIYALGIAVYEIFSGTVPFRGDTPVATLFKHIQDPVPFEGPVAARIPLSAVPVLRKALAKNRADRYESAAEMAEALRKAQQQAKSGSRRRHPLRPAAIR